jgi:protein-tyrosine-phosphatase
MKVLFVCQYNVGRSQMAAAMYNKLTSSSDAESAGTEVEKPGQTLLERTKERGGASHVIDVMQEEGIDVSNNSRRQVTKPMIKQYDQIISMADKNHTPEWLLKASNYVYWHIPDPMTKNYDETVRAKTHIESKIKTEFNL